MRVVRLSFIFLAGALVAGCAKKPSVPMPAQANTSAIGSWTSSHSDSPGEVVMPGQSPGNPFTNYQINFDRDGTFRKTGGMPVSGTWKQSDHVVTLRVTNLDLRIKDESGPKASFSMDMALSSDGKTLSDRGGGGIKYHRG